MDMDHLFPFGGGPTEAADVPLPPAEVSPTEIGSTAALGAAQAAQSPPPAVPSDSDLSSSNRRSRRGRSESTADFAAQMKDMQHSILKTLKVSLSEVAAVQKRQTVKISSRTDAIAAESHTRAADVRRLDERMAQMQLGQEGGGSQGVPAAKLGPAAQGAPAASSQSEAWVASQAAAALAAAREKDKEKSMPVPTTPPTAARPQKGRQ